MLSRLGIDSQDKWLVQCSVQPAFNPVWTAVFRCHEKTTPK